jgi:hypothetical protein
MQATDRCAILVTVNSTARLEGHIDSDRRCTAHQASEHTDATHASSPKNAGLKTRVDAREEILSLVTCQTLDARRLLPFSKNAKIAPANNSKLAAHHHFRRRAPLFFARNG